MFCKTSQTVQFHRHNWGGNLKRRRLSKTYTVVSQQKVSRKSRSQLRLEKNTYLMDDKQKQITDLFEIVNTMDRLISENQNFKNVFYQFSQRHFSTQYRTNRGTNKNLERTAKKTSILNLNSSLRIFI
jgi:hypothetical protein